ncbi:MAG: MFS transporter [Oscillospiraceae bacterium]|nr:MFS transporter [Oscillospiraceae bacterium]
MKKETRLGFLTSQKERAAYCLFFLGQNILWGFAGYVETYLTDIGIAAATAAVVLLVPKLWDAANDVIFGYIIDRHTFKNGQKFIPWVRIGTTAIGITTVALFAIPESLPQAVKVVWFLVAYILFDIAYTVLDAPAFAVTTVMTSNVTERTSIIAGGKLWAMVGGVVATLLIPILRPKLGWFAACAAFVAVSVVLMVPMMVAVKERNTAAAAAADNPGFKEMLHYLKHNKYLIVTLIAMLVLGLASLEQKMAIYMGRICIGQESAATLVAAGAAISVIVVSALVPVLARRWDKFNVMCTGLAFAIVMDVAAYFLGYDNLIVALIMTTLKCSGLGFWSVVIYMLIADTVEYGTYKTGTRAAGISFSLQTFISKLKNGLIGSVILLSLSAVGFVEGEGAVQPAGVADGVWALFCLLPAVGFAIALIILLLGYKLRSGDVQTMSQYNNGEIGREEAEALLAERYGPAGEA